MSNTWIKMCGLKQRAEIEIAVELGVDAVGLVFYAPSVRNIGINEIDELLTCELKGTKVVALFVNPSREEVEAVLSSGRIDLLQFHGCEEPEFCESFEVPYLKALGVEASVDTEE
ncbi:MAG: N-(5'-phosphoribosyl)anthranilate isomerase, partial [Pseudomonadales bacterium]|nr:N-(5'-phosphoribosyl)anthranilate isomerase [Pseudomonadales bacterium]